MHRYNFKWVKGRKIALTTREGLKCLFVSNYIAFTVELGKFVLDASFRGGISIHAIEYFLRRQCGELGITSRNLREHLSSLRTLTCQLEILKSARSLPDLDLSVKKNLQAVSAQTIIGEAVTREFLSFYDDLCHDVLFVTNTDITELSGDGHEKLLVKLCAGSEPPKRSGRPRHCGGGPRPFGNGWFMLVTTFGTVVGVQDMLNP